MKLDFRAMPLYFKENMVALSIKMVITPLLMLLYFWLFVDFNSEAMQVTFLEIAMHSMTMAVVLAIRGGS